jgi:hypothetical protein
MDDLKVVKAQVKSWERSFKAEHNKLPTKADIKAVPEIGEEEEEEEAEDVETW